MCECPLFGIGVEEYSLVWRIEDTNGFGQLLENKLVDLIHENTNGDFVDDYRKSFRLGLADSKI